jgi:hypothetical protein
MREILGIGKDFWRKAARTAKTLKVRKEQIRE